MLKRTLKKLTFNRLKRLRRHYRALSPQLLAKTENEKKELAYFRRQFRKHVKLARRLLITRFFLYFVLYIGAVATVLSFIPLFRTIVFLSSSYANATVTAFLLLCIYALSVRINMEVSLLEQALSHLTYFYYNNKKRSTEDTLEKLRDVF